MSATVTSLHETEFFDTDSLRLLRNHLTLGIQGGRWCLDTPDGPISLAGSDRGVPPTLSRLVRAYTRDDELVLVARLRGGPAELRARLGDRLAAPSRPPDHSARGVVLEYVRAQIAALAAADLAVRRGMPDSVHQLRVATRRLRRVFTAYAPVLGGRKLLKGLGGALRWLGGELAPAQLAGARVPRALDSYRYLQLLNALDVLEVVLSEQPRHDWPKAARRPAAKVLPPLARAVAEEVDDRVAALPTAPDRELAVHDIRKAAERLRYALEAAAPVMPVDARLLGEFQHSMVAGEPAGVRRAWCDLRRDLRPLWTRSVEGT
ncbi:CHAD domain-containing protein [Amycolatopsis sp. NPDC021455]|uniref:CHAD domain-containing protein n=1 Tax=Amycolatopsis sp. NPDC021455 TaxID=3154901 RepID=UPI0033EDBC52